MTDDGQIPEAHGAATPAVWDLGEPSGPPIHSICPFLLSADGAWRSVDAVREHRCTAVTPAAPLAAEKQRRLCLTAEHVTCATYLAAGEARATGYRPSSHRRPIARTTPLILDQGRLAVPLPTIAASPGARQAILIGLLGLAFGAILIARLASGDGGSATGVVIPVGSPTSSSSAPHGAAATDPRGSAAPSSEATGDPTIPSPTLVPTEVKPTPAAAGAPTTYKVKKGDTLSGIAAKVGTTVKVLAKLNKITDPSTIRVGQVLKLP